MQILHFLWTHIVKAPIVNLLLLSLYFTHDLALSIVSIVVAIQLIFIPITIQRYKHMQKIANLYPKLKSLIKKYANSPKKLKEAQTKLYAEHGIRSYLNWLPFVITIPVLIALYQTVTIFTNSQNITQLSAFIYPPVQRIIGDILHLEFNTPLLNIDLLKNSPGFFIWLYVILSAILNLIIYHFYNYLPKETAIEEIMEQFKNMPHNNKDELRTFATTFYYTRYLQFLISPLLIAFLLKNYPAVLIFYFIVSTIVQIIINGILFIITKGGVKIPAKTS